MKNLLVTFAVVLATGVAPVLADGKDTDPKTEAVFARQFAGAENVRWTVVDSDHKKVTFTLGGTRAEAYFNDEGELLGTIRNIFYSKLPLLVMQSINSRYADPVIIEVKEITNNDGTSYRVVFEQKNKKYSLKLNSMGDVTSTDKIRK